MKTWQEEARDLLPPTQAEIDECAEGIVSHTTADGTMLYYDRERGEWVKREGNSS